MKPKPKFDPSKPLPNPRHEAFVQAILQGAKHSDAFRAAGYKSTRPETVWQESWKLTRHPQVSNRLAYLESQAADETVLTRAWLIREARATCASARSAGHHAAALKALQMLGLERATFIPKAELGGPGDFSEISDNELREYVEREASELGIGGKGNPPPRGSGNTGGAVH